MHRLIYHEVLTGSLFVLLSALAGLGAAFGQEDATGQEPAAAQEDDSAQEDASGQEDESLMGDVPDWLEEYGYEDTHDDGPDPKAANKGVGKGGAPRKGASASGKCDCIKCRDKLTGDWGGVRSSLQQEGIAYRGRVTQFGFGVGSGVNPPVPAPFAALGIAGGDTFEYTDWR